ncbi:phosphoribulokinase/uridine kinase [Sarocladium strictum]
MDSTYDALVTRIKTRWEQHSSDGHPRLLIALAGPPGSGKTTIAAQVASRLGHCHPSISIAHISADGFHLPLSTLRALPNAAEALARRGAAWTFDAKATADLVDRLRSEAGRSDVVVPTFDHAIKDPVKDGLVVGKDVMVCLIERNYLLCDEEPWARIGRVVDERWLVEVEPELARRRVAERHLAAGIEPTMEKALARTDENDMVNGDFVMARSKGKEDVLIHSIEEPHI